MKKFKHLSVVLMATALGLSSCSLLDFITGKGVVSVDVSTKIARVYDCSNPFLVKADVEVKGDTEKTVTWKSSDEKVATVNEKGLVTPKKVGKVEITATSTHDTSKSGSLKLEVLPGGSRKKLILDGYDYSAKFPKKEVKNFTGIDLPSFESEEGFYYKEIPESEDYSHCFQVVFEMTEDNYTSCTDAIDGSDLHYFQMDMGFYSVDCWLDQTLTAEMDWDYDDFSDEDAEYYDLAYTLTYFRVDEVWGSKEDTKDTAWKSEVSTALGEFGIDLPFVKLGKDYTCLYQAGEVVMIYDWSPDWTKLDGYAETLEANPAFTKVVEDGYTYYRCAYDTYTNIAVFLEFGYYGNTIYIMYEPKEIDFYPSEKVNGFILNTIQSIWTLPEYNQTEGATFKYEESSSFYSGSQATITVLGCSEPECNAYVGTLVGDGYELGTGASDTGSEYYGKSWVTLYKDKISVQAVIQYESHESTDSEIDEMLFYYDIYSNYTEDQIAALDDDAYAHFELIMDEYDEWYYYDSFTVYDYSTVECAYIILKANASVADKTAGVYVDENSVSLTVGGTHQIEYYFFEMIPQTVTFTSNNESAVTVDEIGLVTAVGAGEATITVKTGDESSSCTVSFVVSAAE